MNLRLEKSGPVARLVIDRPDARNAINMEMWEALPGLIAEAANDPAIRVIELRAAEGASD